MFSPQTCRIATCSRIRRRTRRSTASGAPSRCRRTAKSTSSGRDSYFAPKPPPVRASMEFTVTDDYGFPEVVADDLTIVENGVEQKLETFQEAVSPVSILLALDASGSMRKTLQIAKEAALRFVDVRPEDKLGLTLFADSAEIIEDLGASRTRCGPRSRSLPPTAAPRSTTRWPSRSSSTRST